MHRQGTVVAGALVLVVLAVGGTASGSSAGCAPLSAQALVRLPTRGVLRGDVDGDGRSDRVAMAVRQGQPLACKYVLWVASKGRVISAVVRQPSLEDTKRTPYLAELARVNRGRAAQLVVDFGYGASVDSYGLYAVLGGRIVRMRVQGYQGTPIADTFPSGGSNAGGINSICAAGPGGGMVLVASYPAVTPLPVPRSGTVYVLRGDEYRVLGVKPLSPVQRSYWRKQTVRFAPIFANCAVAVFR